MPIQDREPGSPPDIAQVVGSFLVPEPGHVFSKPLAELEISDIGFQEIQEQRKTLSCTGKVS